MPEQQNMAEWLKEFFTNMMTSNQTNNLTVHQAAADAGYDPAGLEQLDVGGIYEEACEAPGVPSYYKEAYSGGGSPTAEHVARQITQVTEVHQENFTQQTFNYTEDNSIDNSVNNELDVDGDLTVEGDFDFNPVTATGGSVAAGHDAVGATGDGSAASGSGNAAASGGVNLDASTNLDVLYGGGTPPSGPIGLERVIADPILGDRPDININTGAGNQTNVDGPVHNSQVGTFGDGAQNFGGAELHDSPVASGGDAIDFHDNTADHGSGLGISHGDISGHYEDNDQDYSQHAETHGDYSPIQQEQGDGHAEQTSDEPDVDHAPAL